MTSFLRNLAAVAFLMSSLAASAQQDRNLVVHYADKTTTNIDLTKVDSLTFEKKKGDSPISIDLDIHETYVRISLNCTDPSLKYYMSYLEKENFDKEYANDEELTAADKQWMEEMAQSYGMTTKELIPEFTYTGANEEYQDCLLPGHDYIIWVHGMDDDANANTPVTKILFRAKATTKISNTIQLKAEKVDGGISVVCTPDDATRRYTLGSAALSNMYDEFTGDKLGTRDYMQTGLSSSLYDYLVEEGSLERYLEKATSTGNTSLTYKGLKDGTEYYIVAAYVDDEAAICSDITQVKINSDGSVGETTMVKAPARLVGQNVKRHVMRR